MLPRARLPRRLENRLVSRTRTSPTAAFARSSHVLTTTAFGTFGHLQLSPATNTLHQPYSAALTVGATPSPTAEVWPDHLPDLPDWTGWVLAGGLGFGFVAAICLFLINFYPPRRGPPRWNVNHGYREVPQTNIELDPYWTSRTLARPEWQKSWPQYARAKAGGGSPAVDHSASTLRKRKPKKLGIDTAVQYKGLGIAIPVDQAHTPLSPRLRRSPNDDDTELGTARSTSSSPPTRPQVWSPLPSPYLRAENALDRRWDFLRTGDKEIRGLRHNRPLAELDSTENMPVGEVSHMPDLPVLRVHPPTSIPESSFYIQPRVTKDKEDFSDIEAGYSRPLGKADGFTHGAKQTTREDSLTPSPHQSPRESPTSSRASSALNLLLSKGEDAIDYVAGRLAKALYDQVNKDDIEEDLLLPVRSGERERTDGMRRGDC